MRCARTITHIQAHSLVKHDHQVERLEDYFSVCLPVQQALLLLAQRCLNLPARLAFLLAFLTGLDLQSLIDAEPYRVVTRALLGLQFTDGKRWSTARWDVPAFHIVELDSPSWSRAKIGSALEAYLPAA